MIMAVKKKAKPAVKPAKKKASTSTGESVKKTGGKMATKQAPARKSTKTAGKTPASKAKKAVKKTAAKPARTAPKKTTKPAARAVKKPAAKKPLAKKTAAKKPVVKKPVAKKAMAKKAVKKPAAKKTAAKKPLAKKPAVKPAAKKAASPKPSARTVAVCNHIRNVMRAAGEGEDMIVGLRKSFDDYAKVSDDTMTLVGKMTPVNVDGAPCAWHTADGADNARRLMYLHGGGYMAGGLYSHSALCSRLAKAMGGAVLAVDYRLIPENAYPAPVEDAVKVFKWMLNNGPDGPSPARRSFIAGDSAGGGLTLATCMALRDEGAPLPTAAIPISAWTDMTGSGATMKTRAKVDPIAGGDAIKNLALVYLNGRKAEETPYASPLHGNFKGLPPLLFEVGDAETLLDDSRRCHKKARAAGVKSRLEVWPHMPHVWPLFAPYLPEAGKAIDQMAKFITSFK
jgi:epsilon-lactone hydrolase